MEEELSSETSIIIHQSSRRNTSKISSHQQHQGRCVNLKYSNWKRYGFQRVVKRIQYRLLPKPRPHLSVVQPALTNEALRTESQQYNCSTIHRRNAAEQACPEASLAVG